MRLAKAVFRAFVAAASRAEWQFSALSWMEKGCPGVTTRRAGAAAAVFAAGAAAALCGRDRRTDPVPSSRENTRARVRMRCF